MRTLTIEGSSGISTLLVGEKLQQLMAYVDTKNMVIITDDNVWNFYGKDFPTDKVIKIGTGEDIKTLDTVRYIYTELLNLKADRSTFLVGIGGGIVCDITGFVASTYMRGLQFGFVATTLLAQVDASVGGKNGVNFEGFKNMVGVFNQPEFVICDTDLLKTLPERDVSSGFGEIIKHAVIADESMFFYLENYCDKAMDLDPSVIEKLVYDSIVIKSSVVNRDEKEKGERRKLNFGHTFGHAIEKTTGIPHGEAVSIGMVIAASLSVERTGLSPENVDRISSLISTYKLPTQFEGDREKIFSALEQDKKREGEGLHFVLLEDIGKAIVEEIPIKTLISQVIQSKL